MPPRRHRAFRFTWFKGKHTWKHIHNVLDTVKCQFIVYQEEICPDTKRRHCQCWVYFANGKTLARARKIFLGADVRT